MNELPTNELGRASSPYLQQHAGNPVHWREWGADALAEAKARDVPICLSIGYAACHWCHVMAHESFEDEATAALMNERFVNVKVDREERPDVDQIYMNALHALGQQGGWPLTMFLDADGRPFWGGTYFPPDARHGLPSFRDVLRSIADTWEKDRARVQHNTGALSDHLSRALRATGGDGTASRERLDRFATDLLQIFDSELGGTRGAPKFPNGPMVEALWRAWGRTGDARYRDAAAATLTGMTQGGTFDHFGGGLHRYSTDARWLVPHFEKMLYDQTHLIAQCDWGAGEGPSSSTIAWIEREMTLTDGLASSLDADSEDGEGFFYTWTPDEVHRALDDGPQGEPFAPRVIEAYGLATPNFEGRAIPNRIGKDGFMPPFLRGAEGAAAIETLRRVRDERPRPALDDKVLTDWNMAFVQAWTEASRRRGRADWLASARRTFDAVLRVEGARVAARDLHHSRRRIEGAERRLAPALLSDHVEVIHAALALFGAEASARYLDIVRDHLAEIVENYLVDGLPVLTHRSVSDLPVRPSAFPDDPNPSPASRLMQALTLLEALGEPVPDGLSARLEGALVGHLEDGRFGTAGAANALDHVLHVATLVIVAAPDEWDRTATSTGDPNLFVLRAGTFEDLPADHAARALADEDGPVAILCRHHACQPPVRDLDGLRELIGSRRGPGTGWSAAGTP